MRSINRTAMLAAGAVTATALLAGCATDSSSKTDNEAGPGAALGVVTLATHDSWAVPKETVKAFEEESGYKLEVISVGDAGELTNKLVLTKDHPIADAVFGIDNTFASRAVDAGILADYTPKNQPASADQYELTGAAKDALTPVDAGDVCVNVDKAWFEAKRKKPPTSLDDLVDSTYRDLFVTPGAATSSPGFAFLLATIGKYGEDGWEGYWKKLMDNGARVVSGWTDAYEVDFTAGGGNGDRPIVLSYSSSPPFTIPEGGTEPTTSALLGTCFQQVEYSGVLEGAKNADGAQALVDFLETTAFQEELPDSMYVFPVDDRVELPELWAKWAPRADDPITVPADEVSKNRDEWIRAWRDVTSG